LISLAFRNASKQAFSPTKVWQFSTVSVQQRPFHSRPLETDNVHNRPVMNVVIYERICYEGGLL